MVTNLFARWKLSEENQLKLLGYSPRSKKLLRQLQAGHPLANRKDVLDRAALLLSIHKTLRLLYPHNQGLVYEWPFIKNENFGGDTPLEVMMYGESGLRSVEAYLLQQSLS